MDAFNFFFRETAARHLHRALLPVPARPLDLGDGDRSGDVQARGPRQARRGRPRPRFLEGVFAEELDGHKLITNRSLWRNFPTIRCERWTARQHRADRRRQGDRAFLHRLGHQARDGGRDRALRGVPRDRRPRREGRAGAFRDRSAATRSRRPSIPPTCRWSGSSTCKRFWDMDPTRFAFGLMTRSKAITYDNLALRAPEFVEARPTSWWRATSQRAGLRRRHRQAGAADVPAVPAARHDACEPRGGLADVPVLGRSTACRPTGTWCITARARSAAPG